MTFALLVLIAAAVALDAPRRGVFVVPLDGYPGHYLAPEAAAAFAAACDVARPYSVTSSYRSREEQERLYAEYASGQRSAPVAKPGTSKHELGLALDARGPIEWERAMGARGWRRPIAAIEPWHWEYGGSA